MEDDEPRCTSVRGAPGGNRRPALAGRVDAPQRGRPSWSEDTDGLEGPTIGMLMGPRSRAALGGAL